MSANQNRTVKLTVPANDFIDNRLTGLDPAVKMLEPLPPYNWVTQTYVPAGSVPAGLDVTITDDELLKRGESFRKTVASLNQSSIGGAKRSFKLTQKETWQDVLDELKTVRTKYSEVEKDGFLGSLRSKLRSFETMVGPVQSWMRLLPSDGWQASLFCGGVKIILQVSDRIVTFGLCNNDGPFEEHPLTCPFYQAASEIGKMREDMCKALEEIPDIIAETLILLEMFPETARKLAQALLSNILELLQYILYWYQRNPAKKVISALGRGGDYGKELSQKLAFVKDFQDRLLRRSQVQHWRESHQQRAKDDVRYQHFERSASVLNMFRDFLISHQKVEAYNKSLAAVQQEAARNLGIANREKQKRLCDRYRYRHALTMRRRQEALASGPHLEDDANERITWILKTSELEQWLHDVRSTTLLVNGNELRHDLYSTTSRFSALMVAALDKSGPGDVLHWFCGQEPGGSPSLMVQDLTCQLLYGDEEGSINVDMDGLTRRPAFDDVAAVFRDCLVQRLQSRAVYCIIDSASFFEGFERESHAARLLQGLMQLSSQQAKLPKVCPLKVLVTSPMRLDRELLKFAANVGAQAMDVPDDIEGIMQGTNDFAMSRKLGRLRVRD